MPLTKDQLHRAQFTVYIEAKDEADAEECWHRLQEAIAGRSYRDHYWCDGFVLSDKIRPDSWWPAIDWANGLPPTAEEEAEAKREHDAFWAKYPKGLDDPQFAADSNLGRAIYETRQQTRKLMGDGP